MKPEECQMVSLNWTLDRTFSDCSGTAIRVLQREVLLESAAVHEELEPFCCLPTLMQTSKIQDATPVRGMVASVGFESCCLNLGFRTDDETGAQFRVRLEDVTSIRLTAWRVNEKLDALQVYFESVGAWLYLQTGGQVLLDLILLASQEPGAGSLLSAKEIFFANSGPARQGT